MRTTDIAVVGAGPAGIGAALSAARNGARVVLIDENAAPGGHLRWTMARQSGFGSLPDGRRGYEIAAWATDALAAAGVETLTRTVAWGLFEENTLGVASEDATLQLRAGSVIIATGATDLVLPFPGWELPGVMTATAALRLLHLDRVLPGRRAVVLGAGQLAGDIAADLDACGAEVALQLPTIEGVSAGGAAAVAWMEAGSVRTECDAIVLAFGRQPDAQLALQAQVAIEYSPQDGVFVPWRGNTFATSLPQIFVVGDAAGVRSVARAFAEGTVAGEAATGGSGLAGALERLLSFDDEPVSSPRVPSIAGGTIVCRCEEVTASVIREAIACGLVSLNDLKRRTRAGMGICQGVFCGRAMAEMLASEASVAMSTIVPMTARPPARLISMAAMAEFES